MRLRANEVCPIHRSVSCCGRDRIAKPRLIRLGVQRVEDPHHPRGYRELRSPAEMRKLLNRKVREQAGICAICHEEFTDKVFRLVETKRFDPGMNGVDWKALAESRREQILACAEPEAFEKEVHKLVAELKTSHTGFRHAGMRNIPARHAINATLYRFGANGNEQWMFQDVHEGGPAYAAGIRPGDLLLECGGREIRPPNDLTFAVGESASLLVEKLHGGQQRVNVQLPMPKSQKHPVTAPQAVSARKLSDDIGLLKVAMFPGAIGIDVAKDIDRGIAPLNACSRLIVDLRANTGGGIGGLRLMSYLIAGKLEVGYSLTRKRRERGYKREELRGFGRIPSHKATLIWLAARYAFAEKSILVVTEGLGERRFQGRVVLMVNEHTASAGEMVSAFAEENNLAAIVGTKTPGRLLSGSAFKLGHGYILGLPVAAYLTWHGRMLENNGIVPKFSIELSRDALRDGRDTQLETAVEVARAL